MINKIFSLKGYYRNIPVFYLITFFTWLSFWLPIYVLFYQSIGLTYTQILLLISARSFINLILVVPTGIFADIYGRKKSIIIASIFQLIGFIVLYFSYSFIAVFIANLLIGTYFAFLNGADIAMVYDSLKAERSEKNFKIIQSILSGLNVLALSIASVLGGVFAASQGYRAVILLNIAAYSIGVVITFFLKEPPHEKSEEMINNNYFKHLKNSIKILFNNTGLLIASIILGAFTVVGETSQSFSQPLLKLAGLDIKYFGIVSAGFLILAGFGAFLVLYFEKDRIHIKHHMMISIIVLSFEFLLLASVLNVYVAIFLISLGQLFKGTSNIFIRDYSNKQISSKQRATIFSIQGFIASGFSIIFAPLFGYFADNKGVQRGYLSLGIFLIVIGFSCILIYLRRRSITSNIN